MTARRSASLIVLQAPISSTVRPQPTHTRPAASSTQTETQGVEISVGIGFGTLKGAARR